MVIRLAVSGALGRMGVRVASLAFRDPRFEIRQLLEAEDRFAGGDEMSVEGAPEAWPLESSLKPGADVLVDFSTPAGFRARLLECVQARTPFVSGTTGLTADDRDLLVDAASVIPVLHAPNMSRGVELLCFLAAEAARRLGGDFAVEVVETHHGAKVDAPSGTALRIVEALRAGGGGPEGEAVYGRRGPAGPRKPGEIGVHALRGGDVIGEHTVHFLGSGERLELVHRCTDRNVFALGALEAAALLAERKPRLYRLGELLSEGGEISH